MAVAQAVILELDGSKKEGKSGKTTTTNNI